MNECKECPLYDQCAYNGDTAMCLLEEYDKWRDYELDNIQARAENIIRQKRILFNGGSFWFFIFILKLTKTYYISYNS